MCTIQGHRTGCYSGPGHSAQSCCRDRVADRLWAAVWRLQGPGDTGWTGDRVADRLWTAVWNR